MILRLKSFVLSNLIYNIFELVTSWLDTILNRFLHNVDDVFPDFFHFGDSLGIILVYFFLKVTPEIEVEVWKVRWTSWPFNIPNRKDSFLWNL